MPNLTKPSYPS